MRNVGPTRAAIPLYKSITLPVLEYGAQIWNSPLVKHRNNIEATQKSFTRAVLQMNYRDSPAIVLPYKERLRELQLMSLEGRRCYLSLVLFFRMIIKDCFLPEPSLLFNWNCRRTLPTLIIPYARCNALKDSFFVQITRTWNELSPDVKILTNLHTFKQKLRVLFV